MASPASSAAAAARKPRPFIERRGIGSQPGPTHADAELTAVDRGRRCLAATVIGERGGEHLASQVGLMLAGGVEQLGVAREGQLDAVGDLKSGGFAGVLDRVDDLTGEPLAAQLVVELELQGDGVARLGLDLIALERLQREAELLGPEGV